MKAELYLAYVGHGHVCMYSCFSHQAGALAVDIICERANRITGML